jgi:SAM-dependent methyltransferase
MHPSALEFGNLFFKTYCEDGKNIVIMDVGAQDVNGSLRDVSPAGVKYIGIDFVAGRGVDVILDDPYHLPIDDASADVVVCSSVFEHSQFFWLLYLEVLRILKPNGLFYLNAPSNGYIHRYPVDSWRFYPDAGHALVAWGERNGYKPSLLESFIGDKNCVSIDSDAWNDYVAVFVKDAAYQGQYSKRILHTLTSYAHGYCDDGTIDAKFSHLTDDFVIIREGEARNQELKNTLSVQQDENQRLSGELGLQRELLSTEERMHREAQARIVQMTGKLADLQVSLQEERGRVIVLNNQIRQLMATWSWRLTAPLRKLLTGLRR